MLLQGGAVSHFQTCGMMLFLQDPVLSVHSLVHLALCPGDPSAEREGNAGVATQHTQVNSSPQKSSALCVSRYPGTQARINIILLVEFFLCE